MDTILEQALQIVEEVESHAFDLDEYDVVTVARQLVIVTLIESVDYSFDPRKEI